MVSSNQVGCTSLVIKHRCIPSESIWDGYCCCSRWILLYWVDRDQWISELKQTKKIHPTGMHWVNDGIVPALLVYQLVRAEREVGALIFGCTYLVTSTVCLVLYLVCPRNAISSPQNKSTVSHRCFCLQVSSCCLKLSFIWAFWG